MSKLDLDAIQARADRAYSEVADIARQGVKRWRMSIPATPERDSDLIIANALDDTRSLVAELRVARSAIEALRRLPMPLEEESRRLDNRFLRLFDAWIGDLVMPAIAAYDKVTGESQ